MKRPLRNVKNPKTGIFEAKITEEHVIRDIRQCLGLNGAVTHRVNERIPWGKRMSEPGIPDLFGWLGTSTGESNGKTLIFNSFFFIEVKRPGGRRRPAQIAWIEAAQRDGVIAFFAESREQMVAEFAARGLVLKNS